MSNGLKGVVAAQTRISHIDGQKGKLIYRGYDIQNIAQEYSFEEVAFLIWNGRFPTRIELSELSKQIRDKRKLTKEMKAIMDVLPSNMEYMGVLRTVISAEGTLHYQWKPNLAQSITLTAIIPTIISYWRAKQSNKPFTSPNDELDHVENYLYMLNGARPTKAQVRALETYMILTLEHGMNASTFSARVTASTESDIVSAICAAIGTMKGPLHGGAPSGVLALLDEIQTMDQAESVIQRKIHNGEKLMGFGHRVYKTHDPRAVALRNVLLEMDGEDPWLDLALHVENEAIHILNEYKPGRSLYTSVEFYAAAIMKSICMDSELFTPTFTASRIVGWTAHVLEQAEHNVIYRPQSEYIGDII